MDPKVKKYIDKLNPLQKDIVLKVREIFLKTIPNCKEEMNWGVITFADKKFYLGAVGEKVHVGFAVSGLDKKEVELFEGSGKTMRHIKIWTPADIDEKKLIKLIKLVDKKAECEKC